MSEPVSGGCLCGAVRFRVARDPLRGVIVCHCSLCRRWGTYGGAYIGAPREALELIDDAALVTYLDRNGRQRSFCGTCGASLFWTARGDDGISISAGALDDAPDLPLLRHIYVADAAGWEQISTTHPHHPQGSASPAVRHK